jgi:hypothetical protein
MGWTYGYKSKETTIDAYFENLLSEKYEYVGTGAVVNFKEYYRAVYCKETKQYFADVCLIDCRESADGFNFGYKSMGEEMGPMICNCPERILKIIEQSEAPNDYAKEWRKKCWKNINKKNKLKTIKFGTVIHFSQPISFTNGAKDQDFVIVEKEYNNKGQLARRRTKGLISKKYGFFCNIKGWKTMDWEVAE